MKLGDLLLELKNPETSPQRAEEIVRLFNELGAREEIYHGWTRFADADPYFNKMHARFGYFQIPPIDGYYVGRHLNQSIPDSTITPVQFTLHTGPTDSFRYVDDYKIVVSPKLTYWAVFGYTEWAQNGTGRRAVTIDAFDKNDGNIFGLTVSSMLPTGLAIDDLPYMVAVSNFPVSNVAYYHFNVYQSSGGALNLQYCKLFMMGFI